MTRFVEVEDRSQDVLFPARLEDWIAEDNPVRVVDAFVDELDLKVLGFERATAAETGRAGPGGPPAGASAPGPGVQPEGQDREDLGVDARARQDRGAAQGRAGRADLAD